MMEITFDKVLEYSSIAEDSVALGVSGFGFRMDVYCDWISVALIVGKCVVKIPSIDEIVDGAEERSD